MIDLKGFKRREKLITILLIVAAAVFVLQYFTIHAINQNKQQYIENQREVTTSDYDFIKEYKSLYMGDASNTINLFYNLPLSSAIKDFQLISKELTVQVNYLDTKLNSGKISMKNKSFACEGTVDAINAVYINEVNKSLLYDSVAAFYLISNLETIRYRFTDETVTIHRDDIEAFYGNLDKITNKENWELKVRDPLADSKYVTELADKFLIPNK